MIKTAIIYNHRGRFGKDGTAPVEVRVTVNRRAYYINTGVHVRAREWKHDHVCNCENEDTLNERIGIMLKRVDDIINEHMKDGTELDIDFDEVRRLVRSPDKRVKRKVYNGNVLAMVQDILRELDERLDVHDFRMSPTTGFTNLIFDVELPMDSKDRKADIRQHLETELAKRDTTEYRLVITYDLTSAVEE